MKSRGDGKKGRSSGPSNDELEMSIHERRSGGGTPESRVSQISRRGRSRRRLERRGDGRAIYGRVRARTPRDIMNALAGLGLLVKNGDG
jgi:hypothetical protein